MNFFITHVNIEFEAACITKMHMVWPWWRQQRHVRFNTKNKREKKNDEKLRFHKLKDSGIQLQLYNTIHNTHTNHKYSDNSGYYSILHMVPKEEEEEEKTPTQTHAFNICRLVMHSVNDYLC